MKNKMSYQDNAVLGAHNLLKLDTLTTTTIDGVTFTPSYDSKGNLLNIHAVGTATDTILYQIGTIPAGSHLYKSRLVHPNGGSSTTWDIRFFFNPSPVWVADSTDYHITEQTTTLPGIIYIVIRYQVTIDEYFYPLLVLDEDTADYAPYAMTNLEITNKLSNVGTEITNLWAAIGGCAEQRLWSDGTNFWTEFKAENVATGLHIVDTKTGSVNAFVVSSSTSGAYWISTNGNIALYALPINGTISVSQYMIDGATSGVGFTRACSNANVDSKRITINIDVPVVLESNVNVYGAMDFVGKRSSTNTVTLGDYHISTGNYNVTFTNCYFYNNNGQDIQAFDVGTGSVKFENCIVNLGNEFIHTSASQNNFLNIDSCSITCKRMIRVGGLSTSTTTLMSDTHISNCTITCNADAIVSGENYTSNIGITNFYMSNCKISCVNLVAVRLATLQNFNIDNCYISASHLLDGYQLDGDSSSIVNFVNDFTVRNCNIVSSNNLIHAAKQGVFQALNVTIDSNTISSLSYVLYDPYAATTGVSIRQLVFTNNNILSVDDKGIQFVRDNTTLTLLNFSNNVAENITISSSGLWFTGTATKLVVVGNYIEGRPELQQGVGQKTVWTGTATTVSAGTLYTFSSSDWLSLAKMAKLVYRKVGSDGANTNVSVLMSFDDSSSASISIESTLPLTNLSNVVISNRRVYIDGSSGIFVAETCTGQMQGQTATTNNVYCVPVSLVLLY